LLTRTLTELPAVPDASAWINYVRCHDDIGWGLDDADVRAVGQDPVATRRFCADYYAGDHPDSDAEGYRFQQEPTGEARTSGTTAALCGLQKALIEGEPEDVDQALRRALLLHNVVFAMRGIPLLYSGAEVGQLNDFSYLTDPYRAGDNRWVHRPPMDWDRVARRNVEGTAQQRLFDGIRRLASTRADHVAFHARADERVIRAGDDRVFAVERRRDGERLLCLSNFAGSPATVDTGVLPDVWSAGGVTDVLTGETRHYPDGRLVLEPYGYQWLEPAPDATPGAPVETAVHVEVHTEWGEQLSLTGSIDALGNWDVDAAVPLSAEEYPTWQASLEVPEGTCFEFEWLKERGDGSYEWSGHRYAAVAGGETVWRLD
jgi:amylosucrase